MVPVGSFPHLRLTLSDLFRLDLKKKISIIKYFVLLLIIKTHWHVAATFLAFLLTKSRFVLFIISVISVLRLKEIDRLLAAFSFKIEVNNFMQI